MYKTKVKSIGEFANAFEEEKMIILFGEQAPSELIDYCYIIEVNSVKNTITDSNVLKIDDENFQITKVGTSVNKNLNDLGHITIKFDGSSIAEQSGSLYVENKDIPKINEGSIIEII